MALEGEEDGQSFGKTSSQLPAQTPFQKTANGMIKDALKGGGQGAGGPDGQVISEKGHTEIRREDAGQIVDEDEP